MRYTAILLVAVAACGGNNTKKDAPDVSDDMAPPIDAPPLPACAPRAGNTVSVRQIGATITNGSIMLATSPPNDGRLFAVLQDGRIFVFENEVMNPTPFLDLDAIPNTGFVSDTPNQERGLLGLAFHPNYAFNREFFIFYTTNSANVIARYHQSPTDPNRAETTGEVILSIPDFATNHNGGMIEFGKDGYLYIGTGDGGGTGDPRRNGQTIDRNACEVSGCEPLLGKILRIDVNTTTGLKKYGIPADNPFAAGGGEPEIYIIGLRNPWRWSFDTATGDMYIGDVGQGLLEEVDVLPAGQQAGVNLGWSRYEANQCYASNYAGCISANYNTAPHTGPAYQRTHGQGWLAVIGGQVYRGTCFPDLQGSYFATDNAAHPLVRATYAGGTLTGSDLPGTWPTGPASIHADARGELFLTTTNGRIFQIEAGP